ncbi:TonB-dependent receptor [Polynucleobacter paneuropaeus]|uniref:TonB-dependent receptor n=1 Tax=Polynucleobacter paneuropaeus TaxID=2527775 RepID=UPI001BFEE210|nr:TonB-dependent receptor [Polynucleobacter paneuropaeus]MBT8622027.1 TonB-dependent receptor [Polynucleobacter paneuropaeus]
MKWNFSNKKIATLFCGATLVSITNLNLAFAQTTGATVVVTGSRFEENLNEVPADIKVITRDEIANSTSQNIPDVLSQIGGLNVRNINGGGQLNLDATVDMGGYGMTAGSTTLILVDGQRINPIDSSSVMWESVPIDSIERIEVLQGGASVQYGNGAVGGVINIITNGNSSALNQASVSYGSYNTLINNAILRDTYQDTTYQLTANTSNSQGWRQNSGANAYAFDAKVTQKFNSIDKAYIDLFYGYTNEGVPGAVIGQVGSGNPQSAFFKNIGATNTVNNSGLRFGGVKELADGFLGELDSSYSNKTAFNYYPFYDTDAAINTSSGSPVWSNTNNTLSGWQFNLSPRVKANFGPLGTTIVGYEFNKASQGSIGTYGSNQLNDYMIPQGYVDNPTNQTNNVQNAYLLNQSAYGILKFPLTDGVGFTGGARHQTQQASTYYSAVGSINGATTANQTFSANAGDAAFNFNYAKNQNLFIKWDQSYRFPNIDEFWGADPTTGAQVFNGILKPQTAQTYSAGGNWMLNTLRINGSLFSSVSQNEITYNPTTGANYNSPYNVNRRGIVLDSSANLTNRLSIAGGGKFQRSYYADGPYMGQSIAMTPDLLLNARANYLIDQNWSFGGVVNYVSTQHYDAGTNTTIYNSLALMPSYTVGDVYLNYKNSGWDTKFTVKNVGNSLYATYGGYASTQVASGSFVNNYYYYPSDRRAYYLTTKYSF